MSEHPDIRIGDRDRLVAQDRLRDAYGQGALDLQELEERLELALRARTSGDLSPLVADLPPPVGAAAPGEPATAGDGGRAVASPDPDAGGWYGRLVLAGIAGLLVVGVVTGFLQPPVVFGSRTITVGPDSGDVRVLAMFGSVDVVVEEGTAVEERVAAIFGSSGCDEVCGTSAADVTVTGLVVFGSVDVTPVEDAEQR